MTRTHAPTTIAQSLTSMEYRLKILYLALLLIMAVGHLLWSYVDYDLHREKYSVTYTYFHCHLRILTTDSLTKSAAPLSDELDSSDDKLSAFFFSPLVAILLISSLFLLVCSIFASAS